jgi:pimeloyl-ACP methyl ester carboxylesterase
MRGFISNPRGRAAVWFARSAAVLCLVSSVFGSTRARAGNGVASAPLPSDGRVVLLASSSPPVYGAAPPDRTAGRATFVYLHGICGLTVNGCPHFDDAPGWLVCPQANTVCSNGGSAWGGSTSDKAAVVDRALDAARAQWPESAAAPVILVGFSQGAYVAMDVARARPGRYAGLLLLGADTSSTARLRASRVPRVALVGGAYDMMSPKMRASAVDLARVGVPARFESLGAVGHTYVAEDGTDDVLTSMLDWLTEPLVETEPKIQASR